MNADTSFRLAGKKKFRWVAWDEPTNRLELEGIFTADDLRELAGWLDNPEHPVLEGVLGGSSVMDVKLSKLNA